MESERDGDMGTYLQSPSCSDVEGNGFIKSLKSHCQGDELHVASGSAGSSLITGPGKSEPEPQAPEKASSPVGLWLESSSLLSRGFPLFIMSFIIKLAVAMFRLLLS